MTDFDPTPAPPRRRGGLVLTIAVLAFLAGLALMAWAARRGEGWWFAAKPKTVAAPVQAPPAPPPDVTALGSREAALAAQLASLETRTATLGSTTAQAEGQAGRAEAILIVFAARRAIDRGVGLGYLEPQLRARFVSAPGDVEAVVRAGHTPATLEDLRQSLDAAAPILLSGSSDWWAGVGTELRNLMVIHRAGTPSPLPADRLARARRLLLTGNADGALAEVQRLPGAANGASWIDAAHRYINAQHALDRLEAVAIVGEVTQPARPAPAAAPTPTG
jgi:hypothetical protein